MSGAWWFAVGFLSAYGICAVLMLVLLLWEPVRRRRNADFDARCQELQQRLAAVDRDIDELEAQHRDGAYE